MNWFSFALLFCCVATLHAQNQIIVDPASTSPGISEPFEPHYIYIDTNTISHNQLFLFFPGTGGSPTHYKLILQHAASLGYHSIGLSYPNPIAINSALVCGISVNPDCHGEARMEIFDGIDRNPTIDVDSFNSIRNRLFALLKYLDANYPDHGWNSYYQNDEISWHKIKVAGHSQGGGHAGFIATIKEVERAIMISSNDRLGLLNKPAGWMTNGGVSPSEKYFGFIHGTDELVDFEQTKVGWSALGMDQLGHIVLVDSTSHPFENTRQLSTLLDARLIPGKHHGMTAVDIWTPRESDDSPALAEVWTHMIEHPTNSVAVDKITNDHNCIQVFPNPTRGNLNILNLHLNENCKLFNSNGELVLDFPLEKRKTTINISDLHPGLYFLQCDSFCKPNIKFLLIPSQ